MLGQSKSCTAASDTCRLEVKLADLPLAAQLWNGGTSWRSILQTFECLQDRLCYQRLRYHTDRFGSTCSGQKPPVLSLIRLAALPARSSTALSCEGYAAWQAAAITGPGCPIACCHMPTCMCPCGCIYPPIHPKAAVRLPSVSVIIPGMMVWYGLLRGASVLGWLGSRMNP